VLGQTLLALDATARFWVMEHASPDAPLLLKSSPARTWVRTHFLERTLRKLPKSPRTLDLCCGYGFYFSINPDAQGIDGDPVSVDTLLAAGRNVKLGNVLEPLPYDDAAFDYVLAHDTLEHFIQPELESLLREIHRVLSDEGILLVWVPNRKGYVSGLTPEVGHRLFVTREVIDRLIPGLFAIDRHYSEPLPRNIGRAFVHNKEVFWLRKI